MSTTTSAIAPAGQARLSKGVVGLNTVMGVFGADADSATGDQGTEATTERRAPGAASPGFVMWFVDWSYQKRSPLAVLFVSLIAGSAYLGYLVRANETLESLGGSERLEAVTPETVTPETVTRQAVTSEAMTRDTTSGPTSAPAAARVKDDDEYPRDVSVDVVSMKIVVSDATATTTTIATSTTTTTTATTTTTTTTTTTASTSSSTAATTTTPALATVTSAPITTTTISATKPSPTPDDDDDDD